MNCEWTPAGERFRCVHCGETRRVKTLRDCAAQKREAPAKRSVSTGGLGDFTERMLKTIGVTEDRYKAVKELFGLSPTCNCEKRKEWLNEVSRWWAGKQTKGDSR